jgi:hypothetical protein
VLPATPFPGHQASQAPNLVAIAVTVPIEHLALELEETGRPSSLGPRSLAALGQTGFGLLDLFIQDPQEIGPGLEQFPQPVGHPRV